MISIRRKTARALPRVPSVRPGLLHFSQKIDYGLLLMLELAKISHSSVLSLRAVADENGISFFFLQKIALELRRAGLIHADRGKNGGYTLAKPASRISLKDILEALEGPLAIMHCLGHGEETAACVREETCGVRSGLEVVNGVIAKALSKTTLNDLFLSSWKPDK
jgi:Rrf2 family protein